jgi:hypothetical protein
MSFVSKGKLPNGDEGISNGFPYCVRLSLGHTSKVPDFLTQILDFFLQASQLIVHFWREG